ncbi:phosphoribosylanthranilate isomerase [Labrys wisconsinensis]|uniref:N-(5'-phosphoribosyl)anthranilate isomerase n=1 Tax=Labrys wisconsinensis TaxID=425677 RepID=A0ABU0IYZ5_9HYPH|nr:phosphoribosylanthranilate isomerase [Labrys wisconsinensis]MDQ0467232.1 phosphoribosylanthranilate isomerase [Labrys wisconsinensis]
MPFVKICGLSTPDTLDAALDAGAEMIGFVFFAKSPRYVTLERAAALGRRVGGRARQAVLTVDAGDTELEAIVAALRPDVLQLHGRESPERVAAIRARHGLPVMKALGVAAAADLAAMEAYRGVADAILADAKPPKDAVRPGGNGRAFDWTLLAGRERPRPLVLSGGLDPDNVGEAIRIVRPDGVDVSSGVEDQPGVKNPDRIFAFVAAARAAFAQIHEALPLEAWSGERRAPRPAVPATGP